MWRVVLSLACLLLSGSFAGPAHQTPEAFQQSLFEDTRTALSASTGGGTVADTLLFDLNPDGATIASGPGNLTDALGSTGATLVVACDAEDISGANWACGTGGTFVETAGASPSDPTPGLVAPFTDAATRAVAITATNGDYYNGPAGAGAIVLEDFVVEAVVRPLGSVFIVAGTEDSAATNGWRLAGWGGAFKFEMDTPAGAAMSLTAGTVSDGAWHHVLCFVDRSSATGAQCWVNGTAGSTGNPTTHVATSADAGRTMDIGAVGDGSGQFVQQISAVRVWTCDGCLVTSGYSAIALARWNNLIGTYPSTAVGSPLPTTMARATVKHIDIDRDGDGVRRMSLVGTGWVGTARRKEVVGGEYMEGILIEPQSTNLVLQSATFDNASWTEANVDAIAAGTTEAPDGNAVGDTMHAVDAAGDVEHYARQAVTLTATTYTASAWVKAGADADVTHAWIRDNTVANAIGHIVLSTCAAGTKGAGASQLHAESWGNGWCRIGITFVGTAAAHDIDIGYGNADNDTTFDDGTDSDSDLIVWGAQVEAQPLPTSYIATTTGSATRNGDDLRYAGASNISAAAGTIAISHLVYPHDMTTMGLVYAGVDSNNYVMLYSNSTTDAYSGLVNSGGSTTFNGANTSVIDSGEIRSAQIYWAPNRARIHVDGVASEAEDTTVTVPSGTMSTINIAHYGAFGVYAIGNPLIGRIRIWSEVKTP